MESALSISLVRVHVSVGLSYHGASMIGVKLAHYEITARLGSGGMGEVYHATDAKLGRSVALKLLPEMFARDP